MEHMIWFDQILYWHWLILGILCFGLELLLPGAFLIWIGFAAVFTSAIAYLGGGVAVQFLSFAVMSLISMVIGKRVYRLFPNGQPNLLNRRADRLIGTQVTLVEAIVNGQGRVKVDDALWYVKGDDLAVGEKVIVIAVHENFLIVQSCK